MKAASRNIISYLLLCMALLPLVFAAYIQTSEALIHHQMKEELERKNLVAIHVNASQLIWTEKGREAIVDGNMFDVKAYTINGADIQLTGLFDKDEDALFAQMSIRQKNNPDATGSTLALKWFGCFGWVSNISLNELFLAEKPLPVSLLQNNFIQSPVLSCDTPPPESAFI
jgi:hypothetical protein